MKPTRKLTGLLLAGVMCLGIPALAENAPAQKGGEECAAAPARAAQEAFDLAAVLPQEIPASVYGGISYEGDTLVIHLAGNVGDFSPPNAVARYAAEGGKVAYREVAYPLAELERLKDSLAERMGEYSIVVLDANEVTNTLDVTLQQLNPKIISAIQDWVQQQGYPVSVLRFDELGDSVVQSTVAYEEPTTVDLPVSENSVPPA